MRLTGVVVVCDGGVLLVKWCTEGCWVGGVGVGVGVPDGVDVVEVLERQVLGAGDIVLEKGACERCLLLSG